MGAKKKIAPDWRGDVKRLESDQIRLHNGLTTAFQLINNLDSRVRLLTEPSRVRLLTPKDPDPVDSGEHREDKPLEPLGSLGEYLEPPQDVVSPSWDEAAYKGN